MYALVRRLASRNVWPSGRRGGSGGTGIGAHPSPFPSAGRYFLLNY